MDSEQWAEKKTAFVGCELQTDKRKPSVDLPQERVYNISDGYITDPHLAISYCILAEEI